MKAQNKKQLAFVKELPEDYDVDLSKARQISGDEMEQLRKASIKKRKAREKRQ